MRFTMSSWTSIGSPALGSPPPIRVKAEFKMCAKQSVQVSLSPTTSSVGWSSITKASSSVATLRHESISTCPSDWWGPRPWSLNASWNHGGSLRNDLPNGNGTNNSEACMILSQENLGQRVLASPPTGRQFAEQNSEYAAINSNKKRQHPRSG